MAAKQRLNPVLARLRDYALSLPDTCEEFPWGDRVVKVNKKVFVFLGQDGKGLGISTKLPETGSAALMLPFTRPTPYNLGKAGGSARRSRRPRKPRWSFLRQWILESYRAVAPKKHLKILDLASSSPLVPGLRVSTKKKGPRSRASKA